MKRIFIETIRVEDGCFCNLPLHQERLQHTVHTFFGEEPKIFLADEQIPQIYSVGIFKCRILYSESILSMEYLPYNKPRTIRSLRLIEEDGIEYGYKSVERELLNNLRETSGCDEVIIVKNGFLTDTSFSNIVLEDKEGGLYTPDSYLLRGTRREELLCTGKIQERKIGKDDLVNYKTVHLINAMTGIGELCLSVENIQTN